MKKLISISFVLVLILYNFSISSRAQNEGGSVSTEGGGNVVLGLIEDSIIKDASQEMSEILKDLAAAARRSGQSKDVKPLIRSIKRNLAAINYASRSLPPGKCAIRLSEASIQRLLGNINKFNDNLCDNQTPTSSRLTFDPMFNKQCIVGSPNFLMCICPHYPNRPECMEHMSDPDKPKCFTNEDFEADFSSLADGYERLADAALVDSDGNGKLDACENNGKLPANYGSRF